MFDLDEPFRVDVETTPEQDACVAKIATMLRTLVRLESAKYETCKTPSKRKFIELESEMTKLSEENESFRQTIKNQKTQIQFKADLLVEQYQAQRRKEFLILAKYESHLEMHKKKIAELEKQLTAKVATRVST